MTDLYFPFDEQLTPQDRLILEVLRKDCDAHRKRSAVQPTAPTEDSDDSTAKQKRFDSASPEDLQDHEQQTLKTLKALNDPSSPSFEPTVLTTLDYSDITSPLLRKWLLDPYTRLAQRIVRHPTDAVMLTHLLLYLCTSLPSALSLFHHFRWWHGILHCVMQGYYMGPYTLLMHQHIHMRGVLQKRFAWFDGAFPYVLDPLMGHTWNSYFFHHVKHHHVEGNGPEDLSSTIRYQRDSVWDFLHYVGRFYMLVWFDLPRYFLRKRKPGLAFKAGGFEIANYLFLALMWRFGGAKPTTFVFLIPLLAMRAALMVGNWGQHAFVDEVDPQSDFRSSITVIDVPSNRHCYNDGYHTSHHLNPLRHWRDHPAAFLSQKNTYAREHALVFYNIDYFFITISLLRKDYERLAKCMVPLGEQMGLSLEERVSLLKRKTRAFSEEEIMGKFGKGL